MKIKAFFLIIILAAVVAIAVFYLFPGADIWKQVGVANPFATIKILDEKLSYNEKPLKVDITYPKIAGLDDFNQKVKTIIDKITEDFRTNSLANDAAVKEIDPETYAQYPREYDLLISYQKGLVAEDLVSVVFDIYSFEGGAHGAHYFIALNYNPKLKQEVKLADLFAGQSDYLQKISSFCVQDLTKQILLKAGSTDGLWISDGAGPTEENYSVFLVNKDNIVFYFAPYQVAPWALGDFTVTYPR